MNDKTLEQRLQDLERGKLTADFLAIAGNINEKLDRQGEHMTEVKVQLKELSVKTEMQQQACTERLDSCRRNFDVIRTGIAANNVNKQSKSQAWRNALYAAIGVGVAMIGWVVSASFR